MNSDHQCRSPLVRPQNFMPPLLLNTNFVKQEPKIAGHLGQPLTQPLSYNQLLLNRVLIFDVPIYKVFKWPWRHFTSLKLCKCSQIPYPSARVSSTSNITKPITIGLHSTHTMLRHFAREKTEGELSNLWCNTRKYHGYHWSEKVLKSPGWKVLETKTVLENCPGKVKNWEKALETFWNFFSPSKNFQN